MNESQWIGSGLQALIVLVATVGAWWALKSDVRSLREAQNVIASDVNEIKENIRQAGYMSKADVDRLLNDANGVHRRHDDEIADLRREKLSVADYGRERELILERLARLESPRRTGRR